MKTDRISTPYSFSSEERKIISSKYKKSKDWSKPVFDEIKKNIISHLRNEQENTCCYCKTKLGFDKQCVDIEHIVSRKEDYRFGFEPLNLALSCKACNSAKSVKPVRRKALSKYSSLASDYLIVHPHFHNYSDNIEIIDRFIFKGKTVEGKKTIKYCKLDRLKNVEQKAKEYFLKSNDSSGYFKLLLDRGLSVIECDDIIKKIKNVI